MKPYIPVKGLSQQKYRWELKYLLPLKDARSFMGELEDHCVRDKHVDETGSYEICSLYYDTPDLRFYFDRVESVGFRRKIRFRSYNHSGQSKALFVEIKERHKSMISKKRINLIDSNFLERYREHDKIPLPDILSRLEDGAEAREMAYLHKRLGLVPVVMVRYIREPLIPVFEKNMRLTLDTNITAGGTRLNIRDKNGERFLLPPDYGIFELKTNHNIPMWLQSILLRHNMTQTRFSKYCLAVDVMFKFRKKWVDISHLTAVSETHKGA